MALYLGSNEISTNNYTETIVDTDTVNHLLEVQNTYGKLTLSTAIALTTSPQIVPLSNFTGDGVSYTSNGIRIDTEGLYEIWGQIYFSTGFTANDILHAFIYSNTTAIAESLIRLDVANYYVTIIINPVIVTCSSDDLITLRAYNQNAARGNAGGERTALYVKRIG